MVQMQALYGQVGLHMQAHKIRISVHCMQMAAIMPQMEQCVLHGCEEVTDGLLEHAGALQLLDCAFTAVGDEGLLRLAQVPAAFISACPSLACVSARWACALSGLSRQSPPPPPPPRGAGWGGRWYCSSYASKCLPSCKIIASLLTKPATDSGWN